MLSYGEFFLTLIENGLEALGLFYGVYRAKVVSNADPDNLGRIIVHCPQVHGDSWPETWAWPEAAGAGPGCGLWWIPDEGSWVYVRFDHGRPERPIWRGGWWGTGDPNEEMEKGKVVLAVKEGLQVILDRDAKTIRLQSSSDNYMEVSEEEAVVSHSTLIRLAAPSLDLAVTDATTITTQGSTSIQAMGDASLVAMTGTAKITGADKVELVGGDKVSLSGVSLVSLSSDTDIELSAIAKVSVVAREAQVTAQSVKLQAATSMDVETVNFNVSCSKYSVQSQQFEVHTSTFKAVADSYDFD